MDDLKYTLGSGCYWKKKAPDMDINEVVDFERLFNKHEDEQEDLLELGIHIEDIEVKEDEQRT